MATPGQDRIERRLAAILAADVAGYSRLIGTDEAGTARVLREHRAAVDPIVARYVLGFEQYGSAADLCRSSRRFLSGCRRPCRSSCA